MDGGSSWQRERSLAAGGTLAEDMGLVGHVNTATTMTYAKAVREGVALVAPG
jgi:hypothetical protein